MTILASGLLAPALASLAAVALILSVWFTFRAASHVRHLTHPPLTVQLHPVSILLHPRLWTGAAQPDCLRALTSVGVFTAAVAACAAVLFLGRSSAF